MNNNIDVAIIMGSDSDLPIMSESAKFLETMGISYEIKILSVHRCPDEAIDYAKGLKERKVKAIIAGAGGAAHLPGIFAAVNTCPVIGVPIHSKTLNGLDSLYSIVQMPSGIPVATVAINGAKNAAILATQIIGASNTEIQNKIEEYKKSLKDTVIKKDAKLQGWKPIQGNLNQVLPNMMIGGDIYKNRNGHLPFWPGRVWYEADINDTGGFRTRHRILYSNDGLVFVTYDHYETFIEIV